MKTFLVNLDHGKQSKYKTFVPLSLLKLSTFYKKKGYYVNFLSCKTVPKNISPDVICFSPIFRFKLKRDIGYILSFKKKYPSAKIRIGGISISTNFEIFKKYFKNDDLVVGSCEEIENVPPDYKIANINYSYGFTTRGCYKTCPWCIVPKTEGKFKLNQDWRTCLGKGHKVFYAMDNNVLRAGPDYVVQIFEEMKKRRMKIDFNQGLDCILFSKNEQFAEIFKTYQENIENFRFAWDQNNQNKYAVKTLKLIKKYNLPISTWYMLYGFDETPQELFYRIRTLLDFNQKIKPMRFIDIESGKFRNNYAITFKNFIDHHFITGIISYKDKIFNMLKTENDFINFLEIIGKGKYKGNIKISHLNMIKTLMQKQQKSNKILVNG